VISGNHDDNVLTGGAGDDQVFGNNGNDLIIAGTLDGNDTYNGGIGIDTLDYSGVEGVVQINLLSGTVTGSAGNDTIDGFENAIGTAYNNVISGNHDDNVLTGGAGDDQIFGNGGDDTIFGGAGDDTLFAGASDVNNFQHLFGQTGDDTYRVGRDNGNVLIAGETADSGGADRLVFTDLNVEDITISYHDHAGTALEASRGVELRIHWDGGEYSGQVWLPHEGSFIETFEFADGSTVSSIGLDADGNIIASDFVAADSTPTDFIAGGAEDDVITGTEFDNTLRGHGGNDTLYGGARNDSISGGTGNDQLDGSNGDDILNGGIGDDFLTGGEGSDTFIFVDQGGTDTITDYDLNYSKDQYDAVIGGDRISINVDGVNDFDDLLGFASQDGGDVSFDFGNGDALIIANTQLAALDRDAFTFF